MSNVPPVAGLPQAEKPKEIQISKFKPQNDN